MKKQKRVSFADEAELVSAPTQQSDLNDSFNVEIDSSMNMANEEISMNLTESVGGIKNVLHSSPPQALSSVALPHATSQSRYNGSVNYLSDDVNDSLEDQSMEYTTTLGKIIKDYEHLPQPIPFEGLDYLEDSVEDMRFTNVFDSNIKVINKDDQYDHFSEDNNSNKKKAFSSPPPFKLKNVDEEISLSPNLLSDSPKQKKKRVSVLSRFSYQNNANKSVFDDSEDDNNPSNDHSDEDEEMELSFEKEEAKKPHLEHHNILPVATQISSSKSTNPTSSTTETQSKKVTTSENQLPKPSATQIRNNEASPKPQPQRKQNAVVPPSSTTTTTNDSQNKEIKSILKNNSSRKSIAPNLKSNQTTTKTVTTNETVSEKENTKSNEETQKNQAPISKKTTNVDSSAKQNLDSFSSLDEDKQQQQQEEQPANAAIRRTSLLRLKRDEEKKKKQTTQSQTLKRRDSLAQREGLVSLENEFNRLKKKRKIGEDKIMQTAQVVLNEIKFLSLDRYLIFASNDNIQKTETNDNQFEAFESSKMQTRFRFGNFKTNYFTLTLHLGSGYPMIPRMKESDITIHNWSNVKTRAESLEIKNKIINAVNTSSKKEQGRLREICEMMKKFIDVPYPQIVNLEI